jgi:hypothetical protein
MPHALGAPPAPTRPRPTPYRPQQQQQRQGGEAHPPAPAVAPAPAAAVDPFQWRRQHISLPEITLAGPVELAFPAPTPLALLLPNPAEAPAARRLLVAPGAAVTVRGIRGVSLRRPVELPTVGSGRGPGAVLPEAGRRGLSEGFLDCGKQGPAPVLGAGRRGTGLTEGPFAAWCCLGWGGGPVGA